MKNTVRVGNLFIGGDNKISIQSMTNTLTSDIEATVSQIHALERVNCDIVRVSVPDTQSAKSLKSIKDRINIPIVADIHFDYKLAIESVDNGADKVRINPGNIGDSSRVKYLADYLKERSIPIRIGVNSGSISKEIEKKYGLGSRALVESAMEHTRLLENNNFYDIILSVKSSNVLETIDAYRQLDKLCDYPLHIGVTEAGIDDAAIVKSSIGLGVLLNEGIGNTIRVSLTGNPCREVTVAKFILNSLGKISNVPDIISCPTCARTMIDVDNIAHKINERLEGLNKTIKVAVMGCVVNGPGEAKDADIGVAGGKDKSAIFVKGAIVATVDNEILLEELMKRIDIIING